jgi:protein LSM14
MPIPVSIPVQSRVTQPRPQPAKPSPAVSPTRNPIVETAKVATAADVQFLAKNLSETKLSNNVPGAGGYLTQPRRRQFATAASRPMDQDYDFETANAKFNKEDVAKEVKSAGVNGTNETGPSAATVAAALASTEDNFYNPGKSFFDNISCENKDRTATTTTTDGAANPNSWKRGEERKLNMETFGQASIDYGNGRFGRGGYRGGRGGYRGGRGGAGYYPRGAGRGVNPWRGGAPRTNGQNTAETTT